MDPCNGRCGHKHHVPHPGTPSSSMSQIPASSAAVPAMFGAPGDNTRSQVETTAATDNTLASSAPVTTATATSDAAAASIGSSSHDSAANNVPASSSTTANEIPTSSSTTAANVPTANPVPCRSTTTRNSTATGSSNSASGTLSSSEKSPTCDDASCSTCPSHATKEKRTKCRIEGMSCGHCDEEPLRRLLEGIHGVSGVKISALNARVELTHNSAITFEEVNEKVCRNTKFSLERIARIHHVVIVDFKEKEKLERATIMAQEQSYEGHIQVETIKDTTKAKLKYNADRLQIRAFLDAVPLELTDAVPQSDAIDGSPSLSAMMRRPCIETLFAFICTIPVAVFSFGTLTFSETRAGAILCMLFASCVQLIAIVEFYIPAFRSWLTGGSLDLDALVVISTSAAYSFSVIEFGFFLSGRPISSKSSGYFATSSLLVSFVLLSRLMADSVRIGIMKKLASKPQKDHTKVRLTDDRTFDSALLQVGDEFFVEPKQTIVTDCIVLEGESQVDESLFTGESTPVAKSSRVGQQKLLAGTVNGEGRLTVKLDRLPGDNSLTDIEDMLTGADRDSSDLQATTDWLARKSIPLLLVLAAVTFMIWLGVEIQEYHKDFWMALGNAIMYPVAILAVACPCALALAVPLVLVFTGFKAAQSGIIIKSSSAIERCRDITDVVFDKTGTLTRPELLFHTDKMYNANKDFINGLAIALTKDQPHPVSASLYRQLTKVDDVHALEISGKEAIPGKGVRALHEGAEVRLGSAKFLHNGFRSLSKQFEPLPEMSGKTLVGLARDSVLLAVWAFDAPLHANAEEVIRGLQSRRLEVHILSGDQRGPVESAALRLGIKGQNLCCGSSPSDKKEYIHHLQEYGHTHHQDDGHEHDEIGHEKEGPERKVLFVGDGTNDALAVSEAHVGVQFGTVSEMLSSTAAVTVTGNIKGVLDLLDLAQAARSRILYNFIWTALYNVFAILLASGVAIKWAISPRYAGLGELISVLPVILISMSMIFVKVEDTFDSPGRRRSRHHHGGHSHHGRDETRETGQSSRPRNRREAWTVVYDAIADAFRATFPAKKPRLYGAELIA